VYVYTERVQMADDEVQRLDLFTWCVRLSRL